MYFKYDEKLLILHARDLQNMKRDKHAVKGL